MIAIRHRQTDLINVLLIYASPEISTCSLGSKNQCQFKLFHTTHATRQEEKHLSVSRNILLPNSPSHLKPKRFHHICQQLTTFSVICKTMQFCLTWEQCLSDLQSSLTKFKLYHMTMVGNVLVMLGSGTRWTDAQLRRASCRWRELHVSACHFQPLSCIQLHSAPARFLPPAHRHPILQCPPLISYHRNMHQPNTISTTPSFLSQDGDLNPTPAEWMSNLKIGAHTEEREDKRWDTMIWSLCSNHFACTRLCAMHVWYDYAHTTQPTTIPTLLTFLPPFHQDGDLKPIQPNDSAMPELLSTRKEREDKIR